jgi:hypothetical protein
MRAVPLDTLPKVFHIWHPGVLLKRHRTEGYFSLKNESEIWIAGLDDQERVEKILGKEYATIFFNECSQIPYSSVLVALTRLAQVAGDLRQAAYYDLNPTSKGHWTNILFGEKRDPVSRLAGELGFEPRLTESESAVLPLNYSPIPSRNQHISRDCEIRLAAAI